MHRCVSLSALVLSCAFVAQGPAIAQTYTMTDLGVLPGYTYSGVYGLNNLDEIIGYSGNLLGGLPLGGRVQFIYRDGKLMPFTPAGASVVIPLGITGGRKGLQGDDERRKVRITGTAVVPADSLGEAFLYQDHFLRILGLLPGGHQSSGHSVNSFGEVVGSADDANYNLQPVVYQHGNLVSLGSLGGPSGEANSNNDLGEVTGYSDLSTTEYHAFLYHKNQMMDLGALPGAVNSRGAAINNSTQITGTSYSVDFSFQHAFLWSAGKMIDLGLFPSGTQSLGNGINSWGWVVGSADVANGDGHGFLYLDGQLRDLNNLIPTNSGYVVDDAVAINDRGDIAANGYLSSSPDLPHALLLKLDCKDRRNWDCAPCKR
jgi:probable HAF family extracellular repeat protein